MGAITDRVRANGRGSDYTAEKWESALERISPKTAAAYEKELQAFSEWIGLNLDELYKLGIESTQADNIVDRLIVNDKITEYLTHVKESKTNKKGDGTYGYGKMKDIKCSIFKFFSVNGIIMKVEKSSELSKMLKRNETDLRKPTKEEIKNLISVCPNYRLKAVIALGKDTGLRCSDLIQVQYRHVKEGLESPDGFGGFVLRTQKTEKRCFPCFGPESTYYLKAWVKDYEKLLGRKIDDSDYMFPVISEKAGSERFSQLDAGTLSQICNAQIEKLGLKSKISIQSLRYFYQSQLETQLNKNLILKMQGKTIGDSSGAYSKHEIPDLLPLYKQAYHLLTVESGEETQRAELESLRVEVNRLKMQNRSLEHRYSNLKFHYSELVNDEEKGENEEKGETDEIITISKIELDKLIEEALSRKLG